MIDLNKINKAHFIGIGGIGISAAAGILHCKNFLVSGSDAQESEIIGDLRARGIKVDVPHDAINIHDDIDLIVYSVAVPADNPERIRAKELLIPELTYPELLGLMLKDKYGIGVSGTDGKTTTTAMLAKIMIDAGLDPNVVLGSQADFLEGNWRCSDNEYFVFESDEYRRAFDNYNPKIAIVTNIGLDHLDYYYDAEHYLGAFKKYLAKLPADGIAIINNDDERSKIAVADCPEKIVTFGLKDSADYCVNNIRIVDGRQEFSVMENGSVSATISLQLPGMYNISNALAAIAAVRQLGVGWEEIAKAIDGFKGVWRRFERLGHSGRAEVIADYAHTPPAIKQVIEGLKEFFSGKKVLFVFQPHQYARTKNLFSEFVTAFDGAEKVLLADIFYVAGRERPEDFNVSSASLAVEIAKRRVDVEASGDLTATEARIRELADQFDVIMILGAGNIYEVARNLVK